MQRRLSPDLQLCRWGFQAWAVPLGPWGQGIPLPRTLVPSGSLSGLWACGLVTNSHLL